jgi:hypothetical protein
MSGNPTLNAGPNEEQLKAVRVALEKFFGLAGWPYSGYRVANCPPFEIRWDHHSIRADAHGCTVFEPDGQILVCLSSSETPDDLHRTMLHETQHVVDRDLILIHKAPRSVVEARAYDRAEQLRRWSY